jgi:hypothetical protein
LQYQHDGENNSIKLQYYLPDGSMIKEETHAVSAGNNIINLNLEGLSKGYIFVKIWNHHMEPIKLLHY